MLHKKGQNLEFRAETLQSWDIEMLLEHLLKKMMRKQLMEDLILVKQLNND